MDTGWGAKEAVVYDPKVGVKRNTTLGVSVRPVANAIKVLQACIYKSVKTGPFFKSLFASRIVKFNMLMPVFTF